MLPLEIEEKKLDNLSKKIEIIEKLKALGVEPQKIEVSVMALSNTFDYLNIENPECHLDAYSEEKYDLDEEILDEESIEEETT